MKLISGCMLLLAIGGTACHRAQESPATGPGGIPLVDPALVGSWEGRARDYNLFDRVRFEIRQDGNFDVWIRDEHRPYWLEATNGRWKVCSRESDFKQTGRYERKKDGRIVWWDMFTTAPIMKHAP